MNRVGTHFSRSIRPGTVLQDDHGEFVVVTADHRCLDLERFQVDDWPNHFRAEMPIRDLIRRRRVLVDLREMAATLRKWQAGEDRFAW